MSPLAELLEARVISPFLSMTERSELASRIQDAARRAGSIPRWVRSVGWQGTCKWVCNEAKRTLGFQDPPTLEIKPRQALHPLVARLRGSSDMNVFGQIFARNAYAYLRSLSFPRWILDLGANVGYSSAYFLSCFPTAHVIAVEPDPANCELCRRNLHPYGNRARVVLGAAWPTRSKLMLSHGTFGDGREWATQVFAAADREATVEGYDIPSLLEMTGGERIDILKIDIERTELDLFGSHLSSWLPAIQNICIELHGADCDKVFFDALGAFDYELQRSGELTFCLNLRPRA
jgi:FkbM family methyltransferase